MQIDLEEMSDHLRNFGKQLQSDNQTKRQPSRGVFLGKGVLKDEANLQENTFKNTSEGLLQ